MMPSAWSWVLAITSLFGLALAGRKIWWAWYVALGTQALWIAYAIATAQFGFLASSVGYIALYSWNAWTWTTEQRARREAAKFERRGRWG